MENRTDMQAFFKEAGVIAQDEAANLLWEDYTVGYKLDIATGLRTDKPWAAPGPVKNPYTTPKDCLSFFLNPSTSVKESRSNCALYRKELLEFIKGAFALIEKSLVIGELWEESNFGRDIKLLSVEMEHQLMSRLKDQVDMLRKLAFPVFPKYTICPKYIIKTYEGSVY